MRQSTGLSPRDEVYGKALRDNRVSISEDASHWSRPRSATVLGITVVIGIAVSVFLLEFGARALFPESVPAVERVAFIRYDSLLGWSHPPNISVPFVQRDFQTTVTINSLGLRDTEPDARNWNAPLPGASASDDRGPNAQASHARAPAASPQPATGPASRRRMLLLGDSFAWGFGVDYGERISEILERLHPEWEVINAGVNGYGTDQELLYLRERTEGLDPDLVLVLFHPNDFENNASSEQYWYFKPHFEVVAGGLELRNVPVPFASIGQRVRRLVLGRSYLGQAVFSLWRRLSGTSAPREGSSIEGRPTSERRTPPTGVTVRLIHELQTECVARGIPIVLISTPMRDELREIVAAAADATGMPFHALDAAFTNTDTAATHFRHDEHWTPHGHEVAAASISHFLEASGALRTVSTTPGRRE